MIYADTAVNGALAATKCGHAFFGTGHSVFATDAPFDAEDGRLLLRTTLSAIRALDISEAEKHAILGGNARRLLKLN
jgi:aminocarboxymuconate-semialdehyde decarboxylase